MSSSYARLTAGASSLISRDRRDTRGERRYFGARYDATENSNGEHCSPREANVYTRNTLESNRYACTCGFFFLLQPPVVSGREYLARPIARRLPTSSNDVSLLTDDTFLRIPTPCRAIISGARRASRILPARGILSQCRNFISRNFSVSAKGPRGPKARGQAIDVDESRNRRTIAELYSFSSFIRARLDRASRLRAAITALIVGHGVPRASRGRNPPTAGVREREREKKRHQ